VEDNNKFDFKFSFNLIAGVFEVLLKLLFYPSLCSMDWIEERLFGSVAGKNE
jgi:hypothetical protein